MLKYYINMSFEILDQKALEDFNDRNIRITFSMAKNSSLNYSGCT